MIAQRNLSLLSNRLARAGGRRIPEAVLERDYCLAWFLVALSRCALGQRLVFKGGTALKRCYFPDYRFSEDLDFTLLEPTEFETLHPELEAVLAEAHRASGIRLRYASPSRTPHPNSFTFFLGYEGPLPGPAGREVKVDITLRERLVFPLAHQPVLRGYPEYEDLPEACPVQVYSLSEIGAEKVVALEDRARNEPRDLYDVWYLFGEGHLHLEELLWGVEQKWEFRNATLSVSRGNLMDKYARYQKLWKTRLSAQLAELPEFEEVFRGVRRAFRQAGLGGGV